MTSALAPSRLFGHVRLTPRRYLLIAAIALGGLAMGARPVAAQWVVFDPANLGQAVADQVTRVGQYALQGLEYAEAVQGVLHLARQIQQLDSTYAHHKDAAMGRVGQLTAAFRQLAAADASTLLDADFGSWRGQLSGTSADLAAALAALDGTSLSDFLVGELAAADIVGEADLRAIFPNNATASNNLADGWVTSRERGDRIRAGDLATAEAAGRVTALLRAAQIDIDGRRSQTSLSHTALQQAQLANQLTAAEMEVALAQLEALRVQQAALARHEAELHRRALLAQWLAREQAAQGRAVTYRGEIANQRVAWRDVMTLVRR